MILNDSSKSQWADKFKDPNFFKKITDDHLKTNDIPPNRTFLDKLEPSDLESPEVLKQMCHSPDFIKIACEEGLLDLKMQLNGQSIFNYIFSYAVKDSQLLIEHLQRENIKFTDDVNDSGKTVAEYIFPILGLRPNSLKMA